MTGPRLILEVLAVERMLMSEMADPCASPELKHILATVGLPTPPSHKSTEESVVNVADQSMDPKMEFIVNKGDQIIEPKMELSHECEQRLQQLLREKSLRHPNKLDDHLGTMQGAGAPWPQAGRRSDKDRVEMLLGLMEYGDDVTEFRTIGSDLQLAVGYNRVIYGDHGPYVEFAPEHVNWDTFPVFIKHPKKSRYDLCMTKDERWVLFAQKRLMRSASDDGHSPSSKNSAQYHPGLYYFPCDANTVIVKLSPHQQKLAAQRVAMASIGSSPWPIQSYIPALTSSPEPMIGYTNQHSSTCVHSAANNDKFENKLGECLENILSSAVWKLKDNRIGQRTRLASR